MLFCIIFFSSVLKAEKNVYVEEDEELQKRLDRLLKYQYKSKPLHALKYYRDILPKSLETVTKPFFPSIDYILYIQKILKGKISSPLPITKELRKNYEKWGIAAIKNHIHQKANPGSYIGVGEYIRKQILDLEYRNPNLPKRLADNENKANQILRSACPEKLYRFLLYHPLYVRKGWISLGDIYFSQGKLDLAIGVWQRILILMPQMKAKLKMQIQARIAIASWLDGDVRTCRKICSYYIRRNAKIVFQGKLINFSNFARQIQNKKTISYKNFWNSWRGNNAHNQFLPDIDLKNQKWAMQNKMSYSYQSRIPDPVIGGGRIYYTFSQRNSQAIVCYHLSTCKKAWEFSIPQSSYNYAIQSSTGVYYRERLYFCSSYALRGARIYSPHGRYRMKNSIFCLNAKTGELLWSWPNRSMNQKYEGVVFNDLPVILNDCLYIGATVFRGQMNSEVFCLDIKKKPKLKWRRFIASKMFIRYNQKSIMRKGSGLASYYGLIYYCNNLGVVSALDATNGEIVWLAKYKDHIKQKYRLIPQRKLGEKNRFGFPPIIKNGKFYVTPTDTNQLFVYNAISGELIRVYPEIPVSQKSYQMIGVGEEGKIFLLEGRTILALSSNGIEEKLWEIHLKRKPQNLPLLSSKKIYVPASNGIQQIDIETQRLKTIRLVGGRPSYIAYRRWANYISPLSLIMLTKNNYDYLIISGSISTIIYKKRHFH